MSKFKHPSSLDRKRAVSAASLDADYPLVKRQKKTTQKQLNNLKLVFAHDSKFHQVISLPGPGDWLYSRVGKGQTFGAWKEMKRHKPDSKKSTIYCVTLGSEWQTHGPNIALLREYIAAFFHGMPVMFLPHVSADTLVARGVEKRYSWGDSMQLSTTSLNHKVLKPMLPEDAFCLLGITMDDLFPGNKPSWQFVYGQATLAQRVGVFSFHRHQPSFKEISVPFPLLHVLRHGSKTSVHELCHMFGIKHCVYYDCLMKGNNGDESKHWSLDEDPLYAGQLCVVCLRKLQHAIGFNPAARYKAMQSVLKKIVKYYTIDEGGEEEAKTSALASMAPSAKYYEFTKEIKWLEKVCLELPSPEQLPAARIAFTTSRPVPVPSRVVSRAIARPK